ncbi:MAG: hypothetical protein ABWJ97_05820 [Thermoproteus sp.]
MIGYVDHPDGGPIADIKALERVLSTPKLFLSSIIFREAPELTEAAFNAWARVGAKDLAEAIYAYVVQYRRGLADEKALLSRIAELFADMDVADLLAMQRALMISIGRTTCDMGAAVFVENPRFSLYGMSYGAPPRGVLARSTRAHAYLVLNGGGDYVLDWDTLCTVPYSPSGRPEELHPLQLSHQLGYKIATRGEALCLIEGPIGAGGVMAPRGLAKLLGLRPCA